MYIEDYYVRPGKMCVSQKYNSLAQVVSISLDRKRVRIALMHDPKYARPFVPASDLIPVEVKLNEINSQVISTECSTPSL